MAHGSHTTATPPQGIISTRVRVAADKYPAFEALVKAEVLPAWKKSNTSLTVSRRGLGANPNDITLSSGFTKYAEIDGGSPLVKQLGPDGAARLLAKFAAISTVIEQVVRTRVADLSF